ncbi:MAG: pyruvate kinase [Acidimicrobiia bacterium]|nr:pyruvate kinase [Acidimicrobiia bacterium]
MNRRTKIIASIGPASSDETTLKAMVEAGMDVARLNLSHGTVDDSIERLYQIRRISETIGRPVGVMADLPGPKVRIGEFDHPITLEVGSEVHLEPGAGTSTADHLFVEYEGLLGDVHVGDKLSIGDGSILLEVVDYSPNTLIAQVLFGGNTQGRPGLHIPSDRLRLTTPTPHDLKLLDAMVEQDIDMVALSFVRSAHDVRRVGLEPAPRGPLVVAKIETRAAIENLDGIIMESGAIMVARGDLGTECSIQDLPHLQKEIIARCIALGRPAITATQMLESMTSAPSPTRAEASDVANAVFDGTSAVMLSAETAIGADPAHVVATMARIAHRADQEFDYDGWAHALRRDQLLEPQSQDSAVTDVMTMATWQAAREIGAKAILCISRSGFTVRAIARFRPSAPILAFSPEERTIRQLTMSWGATPIHIDRIDDNVVTVHRALETAKAEGHIRTGDIVAVLGGSSATIGATDTLRMVRCP